MTDDKTHVVLSIGDNIGPTLIRSDDVILFADPNRPKVRVLGLASAIGALVKRAEAAEDLAIELRALRPRDLGHWIYLRLLRVTS